MFVYRLAAGLVFLAGVALSRVGVQAESWPLLALGLLAATVGLWHFILGGSATSKVHATKARRDRPVADARLVESDLRAH